MENLITDQKIEPTYPNDFLSEPEVEKAAANAEAEKLEHEKELRSWRKSSMKVIDENLLDFDKFNPDESEPVRKQRVIRAFMNSQFDIEPENSSSYHFARSTLSQRLFQKKMNDDEFFDSLKQSSQKRKESNDFNKSVFHAARNSALEGVVDFDAWVESNAAQPGFKHKTQSEHLKNWNKVKKITEDQFGGTLPEIQSIWKAIRNNGDWLEEAAKVSLSLDDEQKTKMLRGLRELVMENPTEEATNSLKQIGINIVKSSGRGVSSVVRGAHGGMIRNQYKDGDVWGWQDFFGGENAIDKRDEKVEATERLVKAKLDLQADVRRIFEEGYDPVRPALEEGSLWGTIERGGYQVPGVIASTALAITPAIGVYSTYSMMQDDARQTYRTRILDAAENERLDILQNGGTESEAENAVKGIREKANSISERLAPVAAIPNMIMERLGGRALKGKFPFLDKTLKKLDDKISNGVMRGIAKTSVMATQETAIETAQQIFTESVQDLGEALGEDVPDIQWLGEGGVLSEAWAQTPETFVAVLPLAVFGAAGGLNAEKRAKAFKNLTDRQRTMIGFTEADNNAINEAQSPADILAAVQEAEANKDPRSEAAIEATQEEAEAMQRAKEASEKFLPKMVVSADGVSVIDSVSGEVIGQAENGSEAVEIAKQHMERQEDLSGKRLLHMKSMIDGSIEMAKEDDSNVFELDLGKVVTVDEMIARSSDDATRIQEEMKLKELTEGESVGMSSLVLGSSRESFEEGQRVVLNKLNAGSSVLTVVHETAHGQYREALRKGNLTRGEVIRFFEMVDESIDESGIKFLKGMQGNSVTEVMLDEAVAEWMESELLRTRKGKSVNFQKAINENLGAIASSEARGVVAKMKDFVKAMKKFFEVALKRNLFIKKAIREGLIKESEIDSFRAKLQGTSESEEHRASVEAEWKDLTGDADFVPTDNEPFSIGSGKIADELIGDIFSRVRDPEKRASVLGKMMENLEATKRDVDKTVKAFGGEFTQRAISEPRTAKSLNKEAAMRQALRTQELIDEVGKETDFILDRQDEDVFSTKIKEMPIHEHLSGKGLVGVLLAPGKAKDQNENLFGGENVAAQYDDIEMVSSSVFGGDVTPDKAAKELFDMGLLKDNSVKSLWRELNKEVEQVSKNKEAISRAQSKIKEAKAQSRKESKDWLSKQKKDQKKDHNPLARVRRNIVTLDAILMALPPEIRGKVGGYVSLSKIGTPEKALEYLKTRVEKADKVLDTWVKDKALEDFKKISKKAQPKREAGNKPKGKIGAYGHRFFNQVEAVLELSEDKIEDQKTLLMDGLSQPDLTDEKIVELGESLQILQQFGGLRKKSTMEILSALKLATDVYTNNRNSWRIKEENRLNDLKGMVGGVLDALGNPDTSDVQLSKEKDKKFLQNIRNLDWSAISFSEVMEKLLGSKNPLAEKWSKDVRRAMDKRTAEISKANKRWLKISEKATGLKGRKARLKVWKMQVEQSIKAVPIKNKTSEIRIPIDTFNSSEVQTSLGLSQKEVKEAKLAIEALGKGHNRKYITIERTTRNVEKEALFTESEAIYLTMLYGQDSYKKALEENGFGEEFQMVLEDQLSTEAKILREYLAEEYEKGYEPLRKLYASMHGMDLPKIGNYTPGVFYSTGGEITLDVTGSGIVEGGIMQGFLKDRKKHKAKPRVESAFAIYFNHLNQTEHWKAISEISRELNGVFKNAKVKEALHAVDQDASTIVSNWLKAIDGNGLNNGKMSKIGEWLYSTQSALALAWKVGTVTKNFVGAAINGAYNMPAGEFFKGYGRLLSGKINIKEIWDNDIIQTRIESGFSPEARAAISKSFGSKPTALNDFVQKGFDVIGVADAMGTAMGAAITYDYHYRRLIDEVGENQAHKIAIDEAAETIARTAQPVEITNKSMIEIQSTNFFAKLAFVFKSEARQKSAMWLRAVSNVTTGKATKKDVRILFLSHFVMAPMMHTITQVVRDARDDNDDELFDEKYWGWEGFAMSMAAGPLSGLPLISEVFDGFNSDDAGPLGRVVKGGTSIVDIFEDDPKGDDLEWYEGKVIDIMQAFGGAAGATSGSVYEQFMDVTRNFVSD